MQNVSKTETYKYCSKNQRLLDGAQRLYSVWCFV